MIINLSEEMDDVWVERERSLDAVRACCLVLLSCVLCLTLGSCSDETGGVASSGGVDAGTSTSVEVVVPTPDLRGAETPVSRKVTEARQRVIHENDSVDAWGRYGMVLDAHGLYDEALISYQRAAELNPSDYRWPYLSAAVLIKDDPAESLRNFERAIELEPRSSAVRQTYADTLLRAGRLDEAERQYREALRYGAENRNAILGLGELAMRRDALDESLDLLLRAVALEPYDSEVHDKLARVYRRMGEPAKDEHEALMVRAFPEKAPVRDPARSEVGAEAVSSTSLIRRGLAYVRRGRHADAERAFRQVLLLQPGHVKALLNLGAVLLQQGRTAEAIDQLRAALTLAEDNAEVHSNLGVALAYDKQVPEALEHIRTALQLDPNYNEAHYNLGWILGGQGHTSQAEAAYLRALELNPVNVRAHNNLGKLLASRGQFLEAVEHWQDAVAYSRENPEALFNLAVAFIQLERFGEAVALLERGLQQDPNNLRIMVGLATLWATCPDLLHRDGDRAVLLAEYVVQRSGGNHIPSLNLLAAAQAEAHDFAGAVRTSQQALARATTAKLREQIELIRSRLRLYRIGMPYHQAPRDSGSEKRQAAPDELSDEASAAIGRVLRRLCRAMMRATGAEAYNVLQNKGSAVHRAVFRVHFHIIPKFTDTGLGVTWPARSLDQAVADCPVEQMRASLPAGGS